MNKLLLVCLLVFAPVSLASADLKVAVIDLGKAFDAFYKTKDAQAKLKEKQDTYQKEIQDLITEYQHMGEEAQQLQQASTDPTLSQAARDEKAKALDAKKQDLVAMGNKIQEMKVERGRELQDETFRRHKEIVDEISKVITDYSGPQGFDLVLDKSPASASTGVGIVLYNSTKLVDITTAIITQLNATAPPPGMAPAADTSTTPASQ
jgi:outer membrane protein